MKKFRILLFGMLAKFSGKLMAVAIKLVKTLKVGKEHARDHLGF